MDIPGNIRELTLLWRNYEKLEKIISRTALRSGNRIGGAEQYIICYEYGKFYGYIEKKQFIANMLYASI